MRTYIIYFQFLCVVAFLPFLMGQQSCQVQESLLQTLNDFVKDRFQPQVAGTYIYISQLSFVEAKTRQIVGNSKEVRLINKAVQQGIRQAERANPNLKFNAYGHTIRNTAANVNSLIDNFYNIHRTPEENMDAVIKYVMDPADVDVIITGQYIDIGATILLKPLLISKLDRKEVGKMLRFSKNEYICGDVLCVNAYEGIAKAVKDLLDSL